MITVIAKVAAAAVPGVTNFAAVDNASDGNASNNVAGDQTLVWAGN